MASWQQPYGVPQGPPGTYASQQNPLQNFAPQGYQQQYPPQGCWQQQQQGYYSATPAGQFSQPPTGPSFAPPPNYPQNQSYPSQCYIQPTPPSLGYLNPSPQIQWSGDGDADALRKAMKGFGTDEKSLIRVLSNKDPLQIGVIRQSYDNRLSRNLEKDLRSETSSWFREGLLEIIRGPLNNDVHMLRAAVDGLGTKEELLNEVLLGRSNADLRIIKDTYQRVWNRSLENDIKSDLSMKTERHFLMVLAANRNEEASPIVSQQIDQIATDIYRATEGMHGTDELMVCSILTRNSNAEIRAISDAYRQRFSQDLETVIQKEFSGHMKLALLHQLRTGTDKAMRDALLLDDAMSGLGTKDNLLIKRVVRIHWDHNHMQQVKGAYQHRFGKSLVQRIRSEISGDYEKLMCACLGE